MKVTFPHMGCPIGYSKVFQILGHDMVYPSKPSKRTIDLGVKNSHEFACFPMKVLLGTYIEGMEQGADTIVSSGGHGPCRAGYYGVVQKKILQNIGYDPDFIIFDSIKRDREGFMENVKKVKANNSWKTVWHGLKMAYKTICAMDNFDKQLEVIRAYEVNQGDCSNVLDKIEKRLFEPIDENQLKIAVEECQHMVDSLKRYEVSDDDRIKIGVIGEIYVVMEPAVNFEIENRLGALGCEVTRSQYLSEWVKYNMIPHFISKPHEVEIMKKGEQYINRIIGGHAKPNMGHIVDYKEKGYDGIVHLLPFACLPEMVSQSIIPEISKELDIPIISLSLDEQTGLANSLTRMEAFVDLIRARKNMGKFSNHKIIKK